MIYMKKITKQNNDFSIFDAINNEAFPEEERWDLAQALDYEAPHDVMGLYDDENPIGFYIALFDEKMVYICFFAIKKGERSKGYGGQTLSLICQKYEKEGKQVCLDLEKQDPLSDNARQRQRRKQFYLRNGFYQTGYSMNFWNLSFELLCHDQSFHADAYRQLCEKLTNRYIDPHIIKEFSV
jgi:GNAT superfamily N-acetyltransferase